MTSCPAHSAQGRMIFLPGHDWPCFIAHKAMGNKIRGLSHLSLQGVKRASLSHRFQLILRKGEAGLSQQIRIRIKRALLWIRLLTEFSEICFDLIRRMQDRGVTV